MQVEVFQDVIISKWVVSRPTPTTRRAPLLDTKPIAFADDGRRATRDLLRRFEGLPPGRIPRGLDRLEVGARLGTLEAIDRQYGGNTELPLEDVADVVSSILADLAQIDDGELVIGVALWAIRHGVAIEAPEPVVNALANRANGAHGKEELAAVIAITHAVISNVRPRLGHDLERSNPERPWRLLHANLAITAIRTEEASLMDAAFDALDAALPDEAQSFYGEARALALAPGISPVVRDRIEARIQA
jgi:hypothetical protein